MHITYGSIDNNTEVVNEVLSIEKVVGSEQEVPGQRAEPGQAMHPVHRIADVDDLFKTLHLDT